MYCKIKNAFFLVFTFYVLICVKKYYSITHRVRHEQVTDTQSAWGHKELDAAEWLTFNLYRILQERSSIKDEFTVNFFKKNYKIHEEIVHLLQELDE